MQERLRAVVEPIVADLGLELFDLEYSGATLVVTLERRAVPDRPRNEQPSGVGIDDITKVTRAVSRALDEADPIAGKYALEVSSPGLERSLRVPAHFSWAVGQKVSVKTVPGFEAGRRLKGELVRAGAGPTAGRTAASDSDASGRSGSIDLVLDDPAGVIVTIRYDEIDKARTVFEWGGEPKPTKPKAAPNASAKKAAAPAGTGTAAKPSKRSGPASGTPTGNSADKRAAKRAAQARRASPEKPIPKSTNKPVQKPAPAPGPPTGEVPGSSTSPKTPAAKNPKNSKKVTAS